MEKVKLGEITINLDSKRKPLNGTDREKLSIRKVYPYCGANNIMDYIDEYLFDEEILCIAEDGGRWGRNEICSYIMNEKCWVNNHAHVVKTKENVDIRYLKYWLNYKDLNSIITGAIVKKLTQKALNSLEIMLPVKIEQIKIANNLDKIQEIIDMREKQIEELDKLIKSQFVEMFGNNERCNLCEIAEITMGQSPNSDTYNDEGRGIPFFQGKADFQDVYVKIKYYCTKPIKIAKEGDVLISVRAPVGSVNITLTECCIGRGLASIKPKKNYSTTWFLFYALKCIQKEIENKGTGSTFKAINKEVLYKLQLPKVEIDRQSEFVKLAEQIDKQKFEIQKSLEHIQKLQESLMNKYFGE